MQYVFPVTLGSSSAREPLRQSEMYCSKYAIPGISYPLSLHASTHSHFLTRCQRTSSSIPPPRTLKQSYEHPYHESVYNPHTHTPRLPRSPPPSPLITNAPIYNNIDINPTNPISLLRIDTYEVRKSVFLSFFFS